MIRQTPTLTKTQLKKLHDYANSYIFNPYGCLDCVQVRTGATGRSIEFVLKSTATHGNIVDSAGLAKLLTVLQSDYRVDPRVRTMWVGFRDGRLVVWCPM